MVWPKITKLVSLDSVGHVKSNDIQFSRVGHFELCFKMLYFLNALSYRYENNYKNVWLHALKLLKKFGGSATLWSKVIMKYLKNANNF